MQELCVLNLYAGKHFLISFRTLAEYCLLLLMQHIVDRLCAGTDLEGIRLIPMS